MSAPAPPYFVSQPQFHPSNDSSSSSGLFWSENPIDNAQSRMLDCLPFKRPRMPAENHSITVPIDNSPRIHEDNPSVPASNHINNPNHPRMPDCPPFKRPRIPGENHSITVSIDNNRRILEDNPSVPASNHINNPNPPRMPPPPTKGNHIFFKTRPCPRFREGTCPYGDNCNFAHGPEDIRKPPSNWQEIAGLHGDNRVVKWEDDFEIINRHRLCRNFVNGRVCNYGDKCNYRHEDPSKFREEPRFGMTAPLSDSGARSEHSDAINTANPNFDVIRVNTKFEQPWKVKMCNKWLAGGCTYGDKCHFAHGQEELKRFSAHNDAMMVNVASPAPKSLPAPTTTNDASVVKVIVPGASSKNPVLDKFQLKWKRPEKIRGIYADWIDEINPIEN